MKKQVFGRQLKRDTHERKALFKGLASSLTMYERIETTEEKAKAIKGYVDKLVTKAKNNNNVQAKRLIEAYLTTEALQKMLTDIAPRFTDRPGGYTRILKTGNRFSDNASMVIMEWVEKGSKKGVVPQVKTVRGKQTSTVDEVASEIKVPRKEAKAKKSPGKAVKAKTEKPVKKTVKKEKTK